MRFVDTNVLIYAVSQPAADACGCKAVYSEDLSDGQDYDGLRVINPFRDQGTRR